MDDVEVISRLENAFFGTDSLLTLGIYCLTCPIDRKPKNVFYFFKKSYDTFYALNCMAFIFCPLSRPQLSVIAPNHWQLISPGWQCQPQDPKWEAQVRGSHKLNTDWHAIRAIEFLFHKKQWEQANELSYLHGETTYNILRTFPIRLGYSWVGKNICYIQILTMPQSELHLVICFNVFGATVPAKAGAGSQGPGGVPMHLSMY